LINNLLDRAATNHVSKEMMHLCCFYQ